MQIADCPDCPLGNGRLLRFPISDFRFPIRAARWARPGSNPCPIAHGPWPIETAPRPETQAPGDEARLLRNGKRRTGDSIETPRVQFFEVAALDEAGDGGLEAVEA